MMKVLVVIDQFKTGGGARVTSLMLKGLANRGIELVLAVDNVTYDVFYEIPETVKIVSLYSVIKGNGAINVIRRIVDLSKQLKSIIKAEKPNVLIGVMPLSYLYLLIANICYKLPLIAVDHTTFNRKTLPLTSFIRNKLYQYCDALSILTQRDAEFLGDKYPQKIVIYNPLTFPILERDTERDKTILCVGRFDFWEVKGFDRLAEIWGVMAKDYPEWKLLIAGTGSEKDCQYVHSLFDVKCPQDSYEFLGQVADMKELYAKTSIFVLPSRVEGFPMSLMEAMSQGCACIAFSIEGASEEMMTNDVSGWIIEDGNLEMFQTKLRCLIENGQRRQEFGFNARINVERFSLDSFIDKWIKLLETCNKKNIL